MVPGAASCGAAASRAAHGWHRAVGAATAAGAAPIKRPGHAANWKIPRGCEPCGVPLVHPTPRASRASLHRPGCLVFVGLVRARGLYFAPPRIASKRLPTQLSCGRGAAIPGMILRRSAAGIVLYAYGAAAECAGCTKSSSSRPATASRRRPRAGATGTSGTCPCRSRRARRRRARRPPPRGRPRRRVEPTPRHRPWSRRRSRRRGRPPAPRRRRRRRRRSSACARAGRARRRCAAPSRRRTAVWWTRRACWACASRYWPSSSWPWSSRGRAGRCPRGSSGASARTARTGDVHVNAPPRRGSIKAQLLFELGRGAELRELLDDLLGLLLLDLLLEHGLGAPSTTSFASLRPRPVSARTSLMTLILAFASKLVSLMSKNSFSSAAASAGAAAGAAGRGDLHHAAAAAAALQVGVAQAARSLKRSRNSLSSKR